MKEQILPRSVEQRLYQDRNYEYMVISVERDESLSEARRRVLEHSEYGKWELHRSVLYLGGHRRYWMRRKVMNVARTI